MDIALPAIFGLIGVAVGAGLTALLELWRQVLAFRAAARVIRYEINDNVEKCILAIEKRRPDMQLVDEAWKAHRLHLAPLLPQEVYMQMAASYGAVFIVHEWLQRIPGRFDDSSRQIKQWMDQMMIHSTLLLQVERRRRGAQFLDALLARPTFPPPVTGKGQKGAPARGAGRAPDRPVWGSVRRGGAGRRGGGRSGRRHE